MENFHIIKVTYKGATNTRGSRIQLTSERFKMSRTISYDYECDSHLEGAERFLKALGFVIVGHGEGKDSDYIVSSTFEPIK